MAGEETKRRSMCLGCEVSTKCELIFFSGSEDEESAVYCSDGDCFVERQRTTGLIAVGVRNPEN